MGYTKHFNDYACFNRESKELLWTYSGAGDIYYVVNNGIYSIENVNINSVLKQHNVYNGFPQWSLIDKNQVLESQIYPLYGSDHGNLIFYYRNKLNEESPYILCSYKPGSDEIIEYTQLTKGIPIYHYKNNTYYVDEDRKMYSINDTTFEKSSVFDFRKYITGRNYYFENHDYDEISPLICLNRTNDSLLFNVETKTISKPLPKDIKKYNGNYYCRGFDKMYGIDPITFEKSWTIDLNDLNLEKPSYFEILLIDSRGVLIKNEDLVYGFKP